MLTNHFNPYLEISFFLVLCRAGKVDLCKITRKGPSTKETLDFSMGLWPQQNRLLYLVPPLSTQAAQKDPLEAENLLVAAEMEQKFS